MGQEAADVERPGHQDVVVDPEIGLHLTEVDGVRTVWAPVPGPLRAGLMFRVGAADETLPTAGITHLLEHLALFGVGRPGDHSNGAVGPTLMNLHVTGDQELVTGFFDQVTRGLTDPPAERIDAERGVIRAEQAGRRRGLMDVLLTWRYGARTYGLTGQQQYGVQHLDVEAVRDWAGRYTTRGNAVLWLSGPPPAGLRLHLPDGAYRPPPDPAASVLPGFPAWFTDRPGGTALHTVLPRGWAVPALRRVLATRLVDELRVAQAVAYAPEVDYQPLTREVGQLVAVTDLVQGREADGVDAFLGVLRRLGGGPGIYGAVTEEDLVEWRADVDRTLSDPMAPLGAVGSAALQTLLGDGVIAMEAQRAEREQVTVEQVREAAKAALDSTLLAVPPGRGPTAPPWRPAPLTTSPLLVGREFPHLDPACSGVRLVVSPEGISTRWSDGSHLTVRVDSTAAVLRRPDGHRVLVADDACQIDLEPTLWHRGRDITAAVDALWPEHLRIDLPARDPGDVPRPAKGWWLPRTARRLRWAIEDVIRKAPYVLLVLAEIWFLAALMENMGCSLPVAVAVVGGTTAGVVLLALLARWSAGRSPSPDGGEPEPL